MNFQNDFALIVIPGFWNNAIFNESWVSRNLLPGEELEVEYPLDGNSSVRISTPQLRLFTVNNRLVINIRDPKDEIFQKASEIGKKIAEYLPHTPITSFGYNFNYFLSNEEVHELINTFGDIEKVFSKIGGGQATSIKYSYSSGSGRINIEVINLRDRIGFNINFHYDAASLTDFLTTTSECDILTLKSKAYSIVDNFLNSSDGR